MSLTYQGGKCMINLDLSRLNPLELSIYRAIFAYAESNTDLNITKAAQIGACSISKISKLSKKLGFKNFKQYLDFIYGRELAVQPVSGELERLSKFIDDFDLKLVDDFITLMNKHEKIILFGYGPSFIVAQYFEYKLRIFSTKFVIALPDDLSVTTMVDDSTLLVIFTTTGTFRSFESVYKTAQSKGCEVLVVAEEYNPVLISVCDKMFWLSKFPQPSTLQPHEKSRAVFFIYIEEIIRKLITSSQTPK
jgi:DNA-binding MurR/RpiR family transcriptional regulator